MVNKREKEKQKKQESQENIDSWLSFWQELAVAAIISLNPSCKTSKNFKTPVPHKEVAQFQNLLK